MGAMGRVWVLDLDASGTGAEMRPLDSVLQEPQPKPDLALVRRKSQPPPAEAPEPPKPRRFRVVDVMSGRVLAEDVDARATLTALADVHSVVDVRVYVWQPRAKKWRLLTIGEQKAMWERRGYLTASASLAREKKKPGSRPPSIAYTRPR
jgi:hypothetical protein